MKYNQTKQHASTVVAAWENGQSDDQIRTDLNQQGLYPKEVDEVMILAEQVRTDNLAEKVKVYLLDGTFEEKKSEFESIEPSELAGMVNRALQSFSLVATNEVKKMAFAGKSDEEIIAKVQNRFVPEEEIREVAAKFRAYNTPRKGKQRALFIAIGIAFITFGVGLLVFAYVKEIYRLRVLTAIPLIGIGFKALYEAFSSQRVSEQLSD